MAGVPGQPTPGNPNIKDYGFGGKYRSRERDKEIWSKPKRNRWTKDYCIEQLNDLLDILKKILKDNDKIENDDKKLKNEYVRDTTTLINKILDFMRYLYPPVQENLNVNVDLQLDNIIQEWMKKKKKVYVINSEGEVEDAQE